MFRTKEDRQRYDNQIRPPKGYSLSKAMGTTYSLELETLLAACMPLGLADSLENDASKDPVSALVALNKVADKVLIFCDSAQLKMPQKDSVFYQILEKMIVPVSLDKKNNLFPSFHPKTWLLEFENEDGDRKYRFVVLSRNLTNDKSWDIVVSLDGKVAKGGKKKTAPLVNFLSFLKEFIPNTTDKVKEKCKLIDSLIANIKDVRFCTYNKQDDEPIYDHFDFNILPIGIGKETIQKEPLFQQTFDELIIMSPFLSTNIIKNWNNTPNLKKNKRTLITRKSELYKIKDCADKFDIYVLKDQIIDGENGISDSHENQQIMHHDIHAKIFLWQKGSDVKLYLGSLNASHNGCYANIEMMVGLTTKCRYLNAKSFKKDLFTEDEDGKENPFMKVDLNEMEFEVSDQDQLKKELEKQIKQLCRANKQAIVTDDENNSKRYTVSLEFTNCILSELSNIKICPIKRNQYEQLQSSLVYNNFELLHLSEMYKIKAEKDDVTIERIILIPTKGIPKTRDKDIIASVIKDETSFIQAVLMSLGDVDANTLLMNAEQRNSKLSSGNGSTNRFAVLYEKMLQIASEHPSNLKGIKVLIEAGTKNNAIPKDFEETYDVFMTALNMK